MKHPKPKYEKIDVPCLSPEIKEMNGKSTRKLSQCIDALTDLLDEQDKCTKKDSDPRDPDPK